MNRALRAMIIVTVIAMVNSGMAFAMQSFSDTKDMVDEVGRSLVDGRIVTAASIAVWLHDGIVYSNQFGMRDIVHSQPVDGDTQFNIGSVSKVFAATAILLLQREGMLRLDDKVVDHLPSFTMADERYSDITIRMLLNHSSGLPGTNIHNGFTAKKYAPYVDETMRLLEDERLKHAPGDFSPYCNDGFTVAQALLEELTGLSYETFMRSNLFEPLGMQHTSLGFMEEEGNFAHAYSNGILELPTEYVNIAASGGISSTAEDLCRFASTFFSTHMFSEDTLLDFFSEQSPKFMESLEFHPYDSYGLGWDFTSRDPYAQSDIAVLGKAGGTTQYSAFLLIVPEFECAIALLCSGLVDTYEAIQPILETLLGDLGLEWESGSPEMTISNTPIPDDFDGYSGYYASPNAVHRLGFDSDRSSLTMSKWKGDSFSKSWTALHIGDGIFRVPQGETYALRTLLGVPSILQIHSPHQSAQVMMTRIPSPIRSMTHDFVESFWLPTNLHPNDLFIQLFRTSFIPEIPSILLLEGNSTVPYGIVGVDKTEMVLPALRDQTPPSIAENGNLLVGSYDCTDITALPVLKQFETIVVGDGVSTKWRTIDGPCSLTCEVPEEGRIVVLDDGLNLVTDTLIHVKQRPLDITIQGGYIAFISDGPNVFGPRFIPLD